MSFGDDWYLVAVPPPGGVIARASEVMVFDTFGEAHADPLRAPSSTAPAGIWRFFELTGDESADAAAIADRDLPVAPALARRSRA